MELCYPLIFDDTVPVLASIRIPNDTQPATAYRSDKSLNANSPDIGESHLDIGESHLGRDWAVIGPFGP